MKTLIALSDATSRRLLLGLLAKAGHGAAQVATTAAEAEDAILRGALDLVIVDASLQDGDGGGVCRAARACGRAPYVVLVARSAAAADVAAARAARPDATLTRPISREEVAAHVERAQRRYEARSAHEPTCDESSAAAARSGSGATRVRLDGRYELLGRLGAGGMGTVFRARHLLLGELVALKVIHPEVARHTTVRERFLREARAAMRLAHPNVIPVRDCGATSDGTLYMTMDLSSGRSLRVLLLEEGRLPEARALGLARQCLLGVQAAHEAGIVHRDLKPDNVLVEAGPGGEERARVCDFGLAKLLDAAARGGERDLTGAGVVVGTPSYMAPEQATGQAVDARTDVYALGCLLYELVTGTKPFRAAAATQVLVKHLTEAPEPPRLRAKELSPATEAVVLKALAKAPDARFQTAKEMLAALDAAAAAPRPRRALDVLVADDSPVNRKLTAATLARWGHAVVTVGDGEEALARLAGFHFDLLVLDGQMPGLDGYEVALRVRAREGTSGGPRTAIVGLSDDPARCLASGMNTSVSKPVEPARLFEAIEAATGAPRRRDAPAGDALDALDYGAALARFEGDAALLRDTLGLLVEESARVLERARLAVAAGDGRATARAAHELKGAAGNCSALNLQRVAAQLEQDALAGDLDRARAGVDALAQALAALDAEVRRVALAAAAA